MASTEELTADGDAAELNVQQISDGGGAEDHAAEQAAVRAGLHAEPGITQASKRDLLHSLGSLHRRRNRRYLG